MFSGKKCFESQNKIHFMISGESSDINNLTELGLYLWVSLVQSSRPYRCLYDRRRRSSSGEERLSGREPVRKEEQRVKAEALRSSCDNPALVLGF